MAPPLSRKASSVSDSAGPASASGRVISLNNAVTAEASPSRARSGSNSRAGTGRGAPLQPATAFIPEMASPALRYAAVSMGAVGPMTTGPGENASSRFVRKRSVGDNVPETIAISQVPWISARTARSWRAAMSRTFSPASSSRPGGGVPTTTVAGAVVSQLRAAARDNSSEPVSPRTTASTTLASIRLSQDPRASAASA